MDHHLETERDGAPTARRYPLAKPPNHSPPVPRWQLVFPPDRTTVFTAYVGVQTHPGSVDTTLESKRQAASEIESWISAAPDDGPIAVERFVCLRGSDMPGSSVWVCYWDCEDSFKRSIARLDLSSLHDRLSVESRSHVGLWYEAFASAIARLETNYTGIDYLPGLARLPGTSTEEHKLTAYWGAARDRIPNAAFDRFDKPDKPLYSIFSAETASWELLKGSNNENVVHIRSGQFWEECGPEEASSYEGRLEPALESGLRYLWEHPAETGAIETCVTGFFESLSSLEQWAHTHKSHLAIYHGAMNHAKKFGSVRKFRTWHEVSVLGKNASMFQYLNCVPGTGVGSYLCPNATNPLGN
ncbi:hypothetical protein NLU13_6665 [Sarocladium strictum]|uniref:Phenylacetaldoxime dehydratase n=1 Tax=Sarocladium strictum TaxID=5046 RepID=A0AA39GDT6_SARSR|nr:hypothetical protein NLU13_6665 [Sarocladium strictum]